MNGLMTNCPELEVLGYEYTRWRIVLNTKFYGTNLLGDESSWIRSCRVRIYLVAERPEYELLGYEYTLGRIVLNTKLLATNGAGHPDIKYCRQMSCLGES